MTRVEFFFNVPDKFAKIAELCDKAVNKGRLLTIFTPDDAVSSDLQQHFWQQSATSFLPSSLSNSNYGQFSPIILDSNGSLLLQDDVLINLQDQHPPFFSRFKYLVELVGLDESDKTSARLKFRFYRDRGYEIKSTNMAEKES